MKKQKKQNLLTAIIIILVIALIMMVGSIIYEEVINMNKQTVQNANTPAIEDKQEEKVEEENTPVVEDESENEEPSIENDEQEEFVGEEENNTEQEPEMTTDEKVIDLVKKECRNNDSVTISIEKKNGTKYRVAVRDSSTTVLQWYEVNTETWEVSEY